MMQIKDSYILSEKIGHQQNGDRALQMIYDHKPDDGNAFAIYVLLDGVSTANDQAASSLAAKIIRDHFATVFEDVSTLAMATEQEQMLYFYSVMREAILAADQALLAADNFATTVSIAILHGDHIYTANIGDSPILLLDMNLRRISPLYVCQNQAAVALWEGKADAPKKKNVIVKCVGGSNPLSAIDIPTKRTRMPEDFILMLGSDGALSVFEAESIRKRAIRRRNSMKRFSECLFRSVQRAGKKDDFTIIASHINH